jgi:hypothetical protein
MRKKEMARTRVRRISIDERLDGDLVKIGVADLRSGHTDLGEDALDSWSEEEVRLVRPATFLRTFGLKRGHAELDALVAELPPGLGESDPAGTFWRSLEEGQVYLAGEIELRGRDRSSIEGLTACPGAFLVVRIDRIPVIKNRHKQLYSAALKERS